MSQMSGIGLLFAERSGLDDTAGRAPTDSTRLLIILAGLAVVVLVVWLLMCFSDRRRKPAACNSPWRLFFALAKAHRLGCMDIWVLWRLSRFHRLDAPARLFLEPERFDREGLSRPLARHATRLQSLRRRLFAGTTELAQA